MKDFLKNAYFFWKLYKSGLDLLPPTFLDNRDVSVVCEVLKQGFNPKKPKFRCQKGYKKISQLF